MFSPALLAGTSTVPDSWIIAINVAKALVALASLVLVAVGALFMRKRQRQLSAVLRDVADDQPFVTLPDDGHTITVYAKKSRVVLYIVQLTITVGVFTAAGVWLSSNPRYQIGVLLAVFLDLLLGVFLVLGIARLISRSPVLIVNADGITDNATFITVGMGLVSWREILKVYVHTPVAYVYGFRIPSNFRILSTRTLCIVSANQTIVRQQALWKRALYAFNPSMSDVVRIPEFLLPMPVEQLHAQIEEYLRAHGHTLPLSQVPAGTRDSTDPA